MKERLNPEMRQVLKHIMTLHAEQLLTFQNHARSSRAGRVSKPRSGLRLVTTSKRAER